MSIYTEEEASKKWCPFVRHADDPAGTTNRPWKVDDSINKEWCCIGSRCMAWRWDRSQWRAEMDPNIPACGHCGLAGVQMPC